MKKQYWYYPANCPLCGREGELHICKTPNGKLCFQCAECFLTYDKPGEWNDPDAGYRDMDVEVTPPAREEIEKYGWGDYCINMEEVISDQ